MRWGRAIIQIHGAQFSLLRAGKFLCLAVLILFVVHMGANVNSANSFEAYTTEPLKPGYKLFTDKKERFSAAQPLGWSVSYPTPPTDGVIFSIQPNDSGSENVAVNITVTPPATNIIEVAEAAENFIINQPGVENFELIADQDVLLSGSIGVERTIVFSLNGVSLYIRTIYLQHTSNTFALSFTTAKDNIENMNTAFDHMIRNFTIL